MYAIGITPARVAIGFGKIELQCVICGACQWVVEWECNRWKW